MTQNNGHQLGQVKLAGNRLLEVSNAILYEAFL